ncbi:MAG: hypothetical protein E7353_03260 [Clostridiales bacterium]|nr:hypothetical protein [Clostridiales bacterium]
MMEFFNLIADFFNSLKLEYKVLIIAGASALVAFVVILCCVLGYKKHKKKKRAIKEKHEKNKQALDDFMSTPSDGHEELLKRFNGDKESVTSEPKIDEDAFEARGAEQEGTAQEIADEHVIERSEDIDVEFCEDIESADIRIDNDDLSENIEQKKDVFAFVKDKENKIPVGFEVKLREAENDVKANYCDIVNHAMSYKKLKLRKSANSEKGYCGSNLLFMFKIHGKSLRVYYALRFADYEHTTMPVSNESGKKSYDKTPVMLKITGPLSVKRAKMLIDDVAKRFAMEKGKEKTVITAEEI